MIRSMTGFARREQTTTAGTLTWELRTVNHRYLEVGCRLPEEFRGAEGDFRQAIGASVRRGKVDSTLNLRAATDAGAAIEINQALVQQLVGGAREIARIAGQSAELDLLEI